MAETMIPEKYLKKSKNLLSLIYFLLCKLFSKNYIKTKSIFLFVPTNGQLRELCVCKRKRR